MARNFLTAINLNKNELQNAAVQNLGTAPVAPVKGQLYFNSTGGDNTLYWWDGTTWVPAKASATVAFGPSTAETTFGTSKGDGAASTAARSDHTHGNPAHDNAAHSAIPLYALQNPFGPATADTAFGSSVNNGVSNSAARADHIHGNPQHDAAAHTAISLSALAAPVGDVSMGGFKLTNVGAPTANTDAANKVYVDNLVQGLSWKDAARLGTTGNITLSGNQAIDGVTTVNNDRVLVKNQTNVQENGVYQASSGAWARTSDANAATEIDGMAVWVEEGTTNADTAWVCTANAPITVDTTPLPFVQFAGGGAVTAGAGMTQSGNVLNVVGDASIIVTADQISRAALTGDVTAVAGGTATVIANDAVSNAKLANMPASTIKGNNTAGAADPVDMTAYDLRVLMSGMMPGKVVGDVGNGTLTVWNVSHLLNTRDVVVSVYRNTTPWDEVECDVEATTVNGCTLRFAVAPALNEYRVVVLG